MSLSPGMRVGAYEVVALIGEGGMGQVYRARDPKLQRDVALKVLPAGLANDPDRLSRFEREARLLASLNHANIATIHGLESGSAAGLTLVLELVDGPTLADLMASRRLEATEVFAIARQVAEALEAAHEQGIVHRDLKPANIKVRPDGAVKVLDFGLAKALDVRPDRVQDLTNSPTITSPAQMTAAGMILGTAAYMSPEQARGRDADARSDVFAFGCVLYEMLTGRRAFAGDDVGETLAFVITKEPDWTLLPSTLPAPLVTLLTRCLIKDRRQRLQAIAEARIALDELIAGKRASSSPSEPGSVSRAGESRMTWWQWAVGAVVGAAGMAALLSFTGQRPPTFEIPATRFTLETPPNVQFMAVGSGQMMNFSLSPDGRNLVFVGLDTDGASLWLRPMSSLNAHKLPGTEGALGIPFWSPDGQSVAFFTADRLRVIDLGQGSTRTVCDLPPVLMGISPRGTWSTDGTIVFSGHAGSPLSTVAAQGGSRTELPIFADQSATQVLFFRPQFLPDQQRFLFASRSSNPESTGVFVASVADPRPTRVLDADTTAVYALGHLLFVRDNVLVAQRFDSERAVLLDSPRPLGEAEEFQTNISGNLTVAGPLLVYSTGASPRTELIAVDRSGKKIETLTAPTSQFNFELSPDERRVVIARPNAQERNADIWTIDLARRVETRLTFGRGGANSPVWSPDGTMIAFNRNIPSPSSVWLVPADGGPEKRLRTFDSQVNLDDWSPDGKVITFNQSPRLMAFDPASDAEPFPFVETTRASLDESHFSPDGKWIAYNSDESGTWQVYVSPFPATGQRWQISRDGGAEPRWRGDGRELFYRTLTGEIVAVSVTPRLPFEAGAPTVLFRADLVPNPVTDEYAVMADGQRFLLKAIPQGDRPALTVVINWINEVGQQ